MNPEEDPLTYEDESSTACAVNVASPMRLRRSGLAPIQTQLPNPEKKTIKHIVLSGGGGAGFAYYGALRESHKDGFWNIDDIQTMHGVSCGAIFVAFLTILKQIGWDDYDDFCIKRPWESVLDFSAEKLLNAYSNVGICDRDSVKNVFLPLLNAVDLPIEVTLQDFYEFSKIEAHFYATNFNTYELVDISYKTHPDWALIDAIYSSCALPILFKPNVVDGVRYVDGGFLCSYPLNECLKIAGDADEVFGMNKIDPPSKTQHTKEKKEAQEYGNLIEYIADIVVKTMEKLSSGPAKIRNTIDFFDEDSDALRSIYNVIRTKETRAAKVQEGVDYWIRFKTNRVS